MLCYNHMCVCVLPLSPCTALIMGMLIIVWLHGCPSSLGEETETREGCWEVRQHPDTGHLSCHLHYASHGIQCAPSGRQSWTPKTEPHNLPPFPDHSPSEYNADKQKSRSVDILPNLLHKYEERRWRSEIHTEWEQNCKCWRLILDIVCTGLPVQSLYMNVFSVIHRHTSFCI